VVTGISHWIPSSEATVLDILHWVKTRWLSRGNCISRIHECLPQLFEEFTTDANGKSDGARTAHVLSVLVSSFKFVLALCIFCDILSILNLISKAFQKDHVRYSDLRKNLEDCKVGLQYHYLDTQQGIFHDYGIL